MQTRTNLGMQKCMEGYVLATVHRFTAALCCIGRTIHFCKVCWFPQTSWNLDQVCQFPISLVMIIRPRAEAGALRVDGLHGLLIQLDCSSQCFQPTGPCPLWLSLFWGRSWNQMYSYPVYWPDPTYRRSGPMLGTEVSQLSFLGNTV